jgi:hypothetical protein
MILKDDGLPLREAVLFAEIWLTRLQAGALAQNVSKARVSSPAIC